LRLRFRARLAEHFLPYAHHASPPISSRISSAYFSMSIE
jgi:hypothetical protein